MSSALINSNLLEILACPECKGPLEQLIEEKQIACRRCKLAYPVDKNGVPHMIADQAKPYIPATKKKSR